MEIDQHRSIHRHPRYMRMGREMNRNGNRQSEQVSQRDSLSERGGGGGWGGERVRLDAPALVDEVDGGTSTVDVVVMFHTAPN